MPFASRVLAAVLAMAAAAAAQAGQPPVGQPFNPRPQGVAPPQLPQQGTLPGLGMPGGQGNFNFGGPLQGLFGQQLGGQDAQFDPIWMRPGVPIFRGFPAARIGALGAYPLPGDGLEATWLPAGPEVAPGWPDWVHASKKAPLPYAADKALLVRHSDRVWLRADATEAFVPLYFHDKFRTLGAGGEVEVRQSGEFELLLHDSTRVTASGRTAVKLRSLEAARVEIELAEFTRASIVATHREHVVHLPDGSTLSVAALPPEEDAQGARVMLERADEPRWYGGRATITNLGSQPVLWQHAFGAVTIEPEHRVTFFLRPPTTKLPAGLTGEGCRREPNQAAAEFRPDGAGPDGAGVVRWLGHAIAVDPGAALVLEPLQGSLPEPPPARAEARR
jgi:hypothetical protein